MAFVTVVPIGNRPAGDVQSGWQALSAGVVRVGLRAMMRAQDIEDSTLIIPFRISGSFDGGATPYLLVEGEWHGGFANRDGTFSPPQVIVQTTPMPSAMRAEAVLPRALRIGLGVEVI